MAHLNGVSSSEQTPSDMTRDRISNLPWNILNIILCYLPIFDAVRSSVLSKVWRHRWNFISKFLLDCSTLPFKDKTRGCRWKFVTNAVYDYLFFNTGSITHFYLKANLNAHQSDLYQWIRCLLKKDVEVLCIQENFQFYFVMPLYLFSFKKLTKLFLGSCVLRVPSVFGGFNSLRSLIFNNVSVNGDDLNRLILSCPILEKLTLFNITGSTVLRIHAPRLSVLLVDTGLEDIVIVAAPCLATVTIVDVVRDFDQEVNFNSLGVVHSLLGLATITKFGISGDMVKLLAVAFGVGNFPWESSTLTKLEFHGMNFDAVEVFYVCLSMLRSCPNVHFLYFTLLSANDPEPLTQFVKENRGRFFFLNLLSLEMMCPSCVGMGCSVTFLEFISEHAPNLKSLTIVKEGGNAMDPTRVQQMLAQLTRACPQASVQYVHNVPNPERLTL